MKIHGICIIKNEADIIEETLTKSSRWCDAIHVFDTGSTDDTWELVNTLAQRFNNLHPYKKEVRPFRDELRAEVFNDIRHTASRGDWWCRLDADEVYIDDPRQFLAGVPASHHAVFSASLQYYFTERDLASYEADPDAFLARPVEEKLRYYDCNWSEARFCRHRPRLKWSGTSWPSHMGLAHPRRIRIKHFQYRSPGQIRTRLGTRAQAISEGYSVFAAYDRSLDWRDKLRRASDLKCDDGSGTYHIDESGLPRHLEQPLHRAIKRFMHGTGIWA
jgi:glycosyltransferase involved in cell wall biosynthesis